MNATRIKWALFFITLFALMGVSLIAATGANAAGTIVHVPSFPVQASFWWDGSGDFYSQTILSGIGTGYDVKDNTPYVGWCVEQTSTGDPGGFPGQTFTVTLYSTYDPTMPANLTKWGTRTIPWDQINYALNHRQGYATTDVAKTIFALIENITTTTIPLYLDSVANGTGFVPGPGQVVAVILTNGSGINSSTNDKWQENIIEVPVPFATAVTLSSFNATNSNDSSMVMNLGIPGLALGLLGIVIGVKVNKRRSRQT